MKLPKLAIVYLVIIHLLAGYALFIYVSALLLPVPQASDREATLKQLAELDKSAPDHGIALLGDSIIASMPKTFPDAINLGISGDTSSDLAERIHDYPSLEKSRAIVMQIGTNDIWRIEKSFSNLISSIPSEPSLLWYAVPPVDEKAVKGITNQQINYLNIKIKAMCESRPKCRFVDLTKEYADEQGNLRTNFHLGDGVHFSAQAYKVWTDSIKTNIDSKQ